MTDGRPRLEGVAAAKLDRRRFLRLSAGVAGAIGLSQLPGDLARAGWRTAGDPFTLGIASGDPLPQRFVLWTRLAPDLLDPMGGMPPRTSGSTGRWRPRAIPSRRSRRERARHARAGTLGPRGRRGPGAGAGVLLPVPRRRRYQPGRTDEDGTGPRRGRPSCGSRSRPASVLGHGYLLATGTWPRRTWTWSSSSATTSTSTPSARSAGIATFRSRPSCSRDRARSTSTGSATRCTRPTPTCRPAHRLFPWIVTWDDHEVDEQLRGRRRAGPDAARLPGAAGRRLPGLLRAPAAAGARCRTDRTPLYRASIRRPRRVHVLDTRQYRTDQPCGRGEQPRAPRAWTRHVRITGPARSAGCSTGWRIDGALERHRPAGDDGAARPRSSPGQIFGRTPGTATRCPARPSSTRQPRRRIPVVITGDWHSTSSTT